MPKAMIVAIGSEIMSGSLVDSNSVFIAQELTDAGIEVIEITQVPDSREQITAALRRGGSDVDFIFTTGGLGPTGDDLTREAISDLVGESPEVDDQLLQDLRRHFERRGMPMPDRNQKQAWLIPSAKAIQNPYGTAPGWLVELRELTIVALPGPPRENRPIWVESIKPMLHGASGQHIKSRTIKTLGIGESSVEDRIADLVARPYPVTATYAKADGVHIRITAIGPDASAAVQDVDSVFADVWDRLSEFAYGELETNLVDAILAPLGESGHTLSSWENGTRGALAQFLLSGEVSEGRVAGCFSSGRPPSKIPSGTEGDIADFARHGAIETRRNTSADVGLGLGVQISNPEAGASSRGEIAIAVASETNTSEATRNIQAAPQEIRRRSVLWTAEFLRDVLPNHLSRSFAR